MPRPLALFVQDDLRGTESVYACRQAGLAVPDEVAILGVGNDERMTRSCGIPLSSIDIRIVDMTRKACDLLARRLTQPSDRQEVERLSPAGVITRRSSDALAVRSPLVTRAVRLIRDRLRDGVEAEDVARKTGCSRRWLDKAFLEHLGHSCSAEIARQRIVRARQRLADGDEPVETVAAEVGCPNLPRFFRQFRKLTGTTPAAFRAARLERAAR